MAQKLITNSCRCIVVWAKDEQGILRGFIIDRDSKGLSTPKIKGKFAMKIWKGQIFLDDVFVQRIKYYKCAKF